MQIKIMSKRMLEKELFLTFLLCLLENNPFPPFKNVQKGEYMHASYGEKGHTCAPYIVGFKMEVNLYYWPLYPLIRMGDDPLRT